MRANDESESIGRPLQLSYSSISFFQKWIVYNALLSVNTSDTNKYYGAPCTLPMERILDMLNENEDSDRSTKTMCSCSIDCLRKGRGLTRNSLMNERRTNAMKDRSV